MLHIGDLTYRVGGRALLEGATVTVPDGHRVGLVGRNGSGKSTLLRLIAGELAPHDGAINIRARARIGMVAQEAPGDDRTLIDTVLEADIERASLLREAEHCQEPGRIAEIHTRLADIGAHTAPARAAAILRGLGFDETAQARACRSYSGGWRMRVALAAALFAEPDLLLLDEPTNYLDLEGALWLENFLKTYPKTFIMVSHDRTFLNGAVDSILHLADRRLTLYRGGYDAFERRRAEAMKNAARAVERQDAQRKHMQAFIDRFRYKATKARQAQSRIKALEKLQPIAAVAEDRVPSLDFPDPKPLPPPLVTMDDVSVGYDGRPPVLAKLNLRIDIDDRIALLGANGNGKSTFAKLLAKKLNHQTGRVKRASNLKVGYFAQHQLDEIDGKRSAFEQMAAVLPDFTQAQVRAVLGQFGFDYETTNIAAENLSGGEKARLLFALMSRDAPHIMILDEPTNHLDVDTREVLNRALNAYQGAIILISHDRHLVETSADRLWLVADGTIKPYDGDLNDYTELVLGKAKTQSSKAGGAADKGGSKKDARREAAAAREKLAPLRKAVASLEAAHAKLEMEKADIEAALHDPKLYEAAESAERDTLEKLLKRQAELTRLISEAEHKWLDAMAEYEAAQEAQTEGA